MPKKAARPPDATATGKDDVKKLRKVIKGSPVGMLTTVANDGSLRSRPMATLKAPFDGYLWFFIRTGAPISGEIRENQRVNLSYAVPGEDRFVSVSGTASVSRDPVRVKELWSRGMKEWFPQGKKDPELAILRVRVEHAECWDPQSGAMAQMSGLLDAAIAGRAKEPAPPPDPAAMDPGAGKMSGAQG
jgi:general stress protein 26